MQGIRQLFAPLLGAAQDAPTGSRAQIEPLRHVANQTTGFQSPSVVASTGHVAHCLNAGGMGRQDYETETLIAFALRGREGGAMPEVEGDGTRAGALRAASGGSSRDYVAFNLSPSTDNVLTATPTDASNALTAQGEARKNGNGLHLAERSAVRRLTPRECERLQGFPDDYTLVPHRGKPAADGPRYKALGNSMAVPVMRWIGERIQAVENLTTVSDASATDKG